MAADQLKIYSEHEEGETKNALLRLGSACRDVGVLADEHAGMDQLQLESVRNVVVVGCAGVGHLYAIWWCCIAGGIQAGGRISA